MCRGWSGCWEFFFVLEGCLFVVNIVGLMVIVGIMLREQSRGESAELAGDKF